MMEETQALGSVLLVLSLSFAARALDAGRYVTHKRPRQRIKMRAIFCFWGICSLKMTLIGRV